MQIDRVTYRKDTRHPPRWGYQARGNALPSSVLIHTTSNKRATHFATEAAFLRDSRDVSAHYLIGKDGQVVEFLDPSPWQAWHAGTCLPAFLNARSIGIEHHVSVGEQWTAAQHAACTWLVRQLMADFRIPPAQIETHRAAALPPGRKRDPEGWDDADFSRWRATLAPTPPPIVLPTRRYRVRGMPVYERSDRQGPQWGCLNVGDVIEIDDMSNGHIATLNGQPAAIGFIRFDADTLEAI